MNQATTHAHSPLPAIQAQALRFSLGGHEVLRGIDLRIRAGRWTSIVGPNGAGKSTLLKVLAGLWSAQGRICLGDTELKAYSPQVRAQRLAWLGQDEVLTEDLRVWDVVMLGRLPHQGWWGGASAQDERVVQQCLQDAHAWDWRDRSVRELSNGERQRVLLARLLAVQASVMLMDEPLTNLDPPHQVDWLHTTQALVQQGCTVVSVLHEIDVALHADDVVVMSAGRVVHHGAHTEPATREAIESVFEGRIRIVAFEDHWIARPQLR